MIATTKTDIAWLHYQGERHAHGTRRLAGAKSGVS
jgi:hypothetical protein